MLNGYALNIKAGTQLDWRQDNDGTLRVTPRPRRGELADRLQGRGRRWLKAGDLPIAELIEARGREIDGRSLKLLNLLDHKGLKARLE